MNVYWEQTNSTDLDAKPPNANKPLSMSFFFNTRSIHYSTIRWIKYAYVASHVLYLDLIDALKSTLRKWRISQLSNQRCFVPSHV